MIGLKINQVKQFMNQLFLTDCFDAFLLKEATLVTYNTFTIDGHVNEAFYAGMEEDDTSLKRYELSKWADMRSVLFQLIKGKRTPLQMQFILHSKPETLTQLIEKADTTLTNLDVNSLVLTIRFDQKGLFVVTGVDYANFVMDKSLEKSGTQRFVNF